jgi:hypothetical protein
MIHSAGNPISMFRFSNRRLITRGIVASLTLLAATGCSSLSPNLASDGKIRIARVDSKDAIIGQAQVAAVADGVRIAGSLRKTFLRRGRIPGHLHIELLGADGTVLETTFVRYHRRFAKSGRAYFAQTLAVRPDTVNIVRLVHHGLGDQHR